MPRPRPRTVRKYSDEFKLTAVRMSQQPGIQVKTVAAALELHPFMLSKWRKDVREGLLRERHAHLLCPRPALGRRDRARLGKRQKAVMCVTFSASTRSLRTQLLVSCRSVYTR